MTAIALPGFTPVRRRDDPEYLWQSPLVTKAPWTSARCSRLLRPLVSKLDALKRQIERHGGNARLPSNAPPYPRRMTNDLPRASKRKREDDAVDRGDEVRDSAPDVYGTDADWVPEQTCRKRLKNKYSARDARQRRRPLRTVNYHRLAQIEASPGVINVPTPIITRTKVDSRPGAHAELRLEGGEAKPKARARRKENEKLISSLKTLRKSVDSSVWPLLEGVLSSFEALLKATTSAKPETPHGASSLFKMCLKQVPKVVRMEDDWIQQQEDPNGTRDVASEIFDDLEHYGAASSGQGWKPLREVVRAHAIHVLQEAVSLTMLPSEFLMPATVVCVENKAFAEAERLMSSFLDQLPALPPPESTQMQLFDRATSPVFSALKAYCTITDRTAFRFRAFAGLLNDGRLPRSWFCVSDAAEMWTRAIQSVSQEDGDSLSAMDFITSFFSARDPTKDGGGGGRHVENAVKNTRLSVLSTFYVIVTAENQSHQRPCEISRLMDQIQEALRRRQCQCEAGSEEMTGHTEGQILFWRILVDLSSASKEMEDGFIVELKSFLFKSTSAFAESLAKMINMAIRCYSRRSEDGGFGYLQQIIRGLLPHVDTGPRSAKMGLGHLLMTAAFSYADITEQQEHFNWAISVREEIHDLDIPEASSSPGDDSSPAADRPSHAPYRWDEGLCEWILATPAMTLSRHRARPAPSEASTNVERSSPTPLSSQQPLDDPRLGSPSETSSSEGEQYAYSDDQMISKDIPYEDVRKRRKTDPTHDSGLASALQAADEVLVAHRTWKDTYLPARLSVHKRSRSLSGSWSHHHHHDVDLGDDSSAEEESEDELSGLLIESPPSLSPARISLSHQGARRSGEHRGVLRDISNNQYHQRHKASKGLKRPSYDDSRLDEIDDL